MASYRDVVNDDYGRPIPGVLVYVFNKDGSLAPLIGGQANPITTDVLGAFSFDAADAVYSIEFRFAGVTRRLDNIIVGSPPEFQGDTGPTGPANSTYTTLGGLQNAQISNVSALYDGSPWFWTPGNYTGLANDRTIVASNNSPISAGAWVRSTPIVLMKDFGAKLDGITNDQPAFQLAVNTFSGNVKFDCGSGQALLASQVLVEGKTNVTFVGQATRIKGGSSRFRSYFKVKNCSRVDFEGLSFDQLQPSLPVYTQADYPNGFYNTAIEIEGGSRIRVTGCCFDNLYTRAVSVYQATDVDISDNLFTSPVQSQRYNGAPGAQELQHIHFATCANVRAANNRFINAPITSPANGVCSIYASGVSGYVHFEGNYSEYAGRDNAGAHRLAVIDYYGDAQTPRIINNVSRNGMAQFMRLAAVRGFVFAGNRIHASPNAEMDYSILTIESTVIYAPGQVGVQDGIVRDNLFEDPAHRHAFAVGIIAYDWGAPSINVQSINNTFDGCRRSHLVRGPFFGVTIADNATRGAAGVIQIDHNPSITSVYGAEAGAVMRNLDIRNNKMLDDSGGGAVGISISTVKTPPYTGAADNIRVTGNIIRASAPNSGQGVVAQMSGDVPKGRVLINGNEIINYTIGIYLRSAAVATLLDNRIVSAQLPILDEGGTGAVDRGGNRYSDGPARGVARLTAGGVVVPTAEVRAGDIVRLSRQASGGEPGQLSLLSISDGTSLTISSSSATDTSTVLWEIIH